MRPIKLRMSAFGTYSGLTEIDFEKLGTNGLYLITGDTGAGKTTVFDAITYALYGEPSGNVRDCKMLRSKYADLSTPTFAELEFEYFGKRYRIKRDPGGYQRTSRRGTGTTEQVASAELEILTDSECPVPVTSETLKNKEMLKIINDYEASIPCPRVISGNREVGEKILEIMGINRVQFTQIAMIAQGDFLKLLIASTDEREKIFRKIFRTENYEKLEKKINSDFFALKSEHDEIKKNIRQCLSEIKTSAVLDTESMKPDEIMNSIEKITQADREKLKNFEEKLENTEARIQQSEKILERERQRLSLTKKYNDIEKSLTAQREILTPLKLELESARLFSKENEELKKSLTIVEKELTEYREIEKISNELEKVNNLLKNASNEKETAQSDRKKHELQLKEAETEYGNLSDTGENIAKYQAERERIEKRLMLLKKFTGDIAEYKQIFSELNVLRSEYISAEKERRSAEENYSKNYRLFLDAQAGILSQKLEDGTPCPVCGSTSHPCPARIPANAPSETELESQKALLEKLSAVSGEKSSKAGEKTATSEIIKKNILENLSREGIQSDSISESIENTILNETNSAEKSISELTKSITAEKNKLKRQSALEVSIPKIQKNIKDSADIEHQCELRIAEYSSRISELKKQQESISSKLKFSDIKSASKYCSEISNKIKLNTARLETAEKNFSECEKSISELSGMAKQVKSQLESYEITDMETEQKNCESLKVLKNTLNNSISELKTNAEINTRQYQKVKSEYGRLEKAESKMSWLELLCDTAGGSQKGKDKFGLETHVQTAYFDRITERANQRLSVMTGGQYLLKRSETADNKKSHTGLDLNVIDNINGTERSVKTLSGGESFKASLSLALGLSEEIQSSAGGIKLDTMFVDEGFGSLDENSLRQAVKSLAGLSEENRLVGIISHVSELKEKIEKKIVVSKDRNGTSHIEIIV